jgi:hypothetical protein
MTTAIESEVDPRTRFAAMRQASLEAAWLATQLNGRRGTDASAPAQERHRTICEKAYFKAMRRGFSPGMELCDWLEAEREVAEALPVAPAQ